MILAATCGSVLIPVIYGASLKEGGSKTASALYQHLLGSRHRGPFLRESSGVQRRLDAPADQASDQQRRAAFRGNNKNNANANDDDQDVMWLLQRLETAAVQEREHEGGVTGIRQDDGVAPQPPLADSRSLLRFSSHHRKRHHPVLTTFTTARPATATTAAATGTTSTPTAVSASRSTTASVPSRRTTATTTTTTTLTVQTRSTARPTTTTTIATTMTSPRLPMQSTATTTEAVVASTTTTTTTTAAAATTTRRARLTSRTRIRHRGKTDSAVRSGPVVFIDHLVESAMSSLKSQPQYHDAGRPSILMRTGLHFMDMNAQPRQPPVSNRTQVRHPSRAQTTTTTTTHTTEERQMRKARRRGRTRSISALPYEGHVRELRLKSHCSKAPLCVGARPHRVTASTDGCEPSHDTISIRALGVDRKLTIIAIKGAESNRTVCFSKKGKVISRTLKHRVPPLCQFLEEPSNDHRVRYRSRKHIGWYLSFDINGKPRSYCQGGERMCGRRREEHRTRNHRQCTKFSFMFPSRDALNGGDARLSPQQQIELLGKAHPNIPRQFPERSR